MSQEKRTIAIYGATGHQGSSVLRPLLNSPHFRPHALTRDPSRASFPATVPASTALPTDGTVWGMFLNLPDVAEQYELGKAALDGARAAGVKHVVYSSLASISAKTGGALRARSYDAKAELEAYARGLGFETTAFVRCGWFMENFLASFMPAAFGSFPETGRDGVATLRYPHLGGQNLVPLISVGDDLGDVVHGLFLDARGHDGRVVQVVGEEKTFEDMAREFEEVTGRPARYEQIELEEIPTEGSEVMGDLITGWRFSRMFDGNAFGVPVDAETCLALKKSAGGGEMKRWREWVGENFGVRNA